MDVSQLSDALRNKIAYPPEMAFVETGILGQGFYPGCRGFSPQKSPLGGVMLLGRDFGTKSYYERLAGSPPRDETSHSWQRTCEIYFPPRHAPSIHDLPVWCTNYLMGVRTVGPATGNVRKGISKTDWAKYEASCWLFLQSQVLLQQPLVIVVFGKDNRNDLRADDRLGSKRVQTLHHVFQSGHFSHSVAVTFADHPFSLISEVAKDRARLEVKRIRELYESKA